jgi:hypothetical protein
MPTAEKVRDLTFDTIEVARERAEDLVTSGTHGLAAAVNRAVDEVRDHTPDIELRSVEVPGVDELVHQAGTHKLRTTLVVSALIVLVVLLVRKATASADEPVPPPTS